MNYELNSISLWNGFCSSCCWMLIMIPSGFSFCISHGDDVPCLLVDGHLAKITRVDLFFIFQQWWKISKLDLRTIGNLFEVVKKSKQFISVRRKNLTKKFCTKKQRKKMWLYWPFSTTVNNQDLKRKMWGIDAPGKWSFACALSSNCSVVRNEFSIKTSSRLFWHVGGFLTHRDASTINCYLLPTIKAVQSNHYDYDDVFDNRPLL